VMLNFVSCSFCFLYPKVYLWLWVIRWFSYTVVFSGEGWVRCWAVCSVFCDGTCSGRMYTPWFLSDSMVLCYVLVYCLHLLPLDIGLMVWCGTLIGFPAQLVNLD
jgi:hypothetical protein